MATTSSQPEFIYGTAWKTDATAGLEVAAVYAGFRSFDTANQPRHYQEALVGDALVTLAGQGITRDSLFVQTKFTPINGQDHRVPYDPQAPLAEQVRQSFESSLQNLKTSYLDSYLLHGPYSYPGLGDEDWEVWRVIEEIYKSGRARKIGISNVNFIQLAALLEHAEVKPMAVQNRCFANRGWDRHVRQICADQGIMYQGFSLLTANPGVLKHPKILAIARRYGVQPEQVIFRFSIDAGMVPMTGTRDPQHMSQDLGVLQMKLDADEVQLIETIAG